MMKKNLWELKEQALLEMLQALREAELLNFIICLKGSCRLRTIGKCRTMRRNLRPEKRFWCTSMRLVSENRNFFPNHKVLLLHISDVCYTLRKYTFFFLSSFAFVFATNLDVFFVMKMTRHWWIMKMNVEPIMVKITTIIILKSSMIISMAIIILGDYECGNRQSENYLVPAIILPCFFLEPSLSV
ncbi:hypothetical protein HanRHA438_Chr11g0495241 [Helianthus annuus]|nr:hypothetical protein HanRHA438_Chr11g0495241 [Helianthus annuus]